MFLCDQIYHPVLDASVERPYALAGGDEDPR
jgi:hypothetical protein